MTRKHKNIRKENIIALTLTFVMTSLRELFRIIYSMIHHKILIIVRSIIKKDYVNFVLTNETKFMSAFFWRRIHLQLTNNTSLSNDGAKYSICQVKEDN